MAETRLAIRSERDGAERLLVEAAQQDPGRFAELYESHFERVYGFVVRRVRDRDEAQDVTSEVFHRALANLGRFEWRGLPFSAWLLRIAANAIVDRGKRAARERELPDPEAGSLVAADGAELAGIDEAEQRAQLFQLVERLPADQRRVLVLRFAEDRSIREIAQQLARSEGAVKQLQLRALQKLREWLGPAHD
jgi:RNA polymerase sigma-70 factor (ECF subfamily)